MANPTIGFIECAFGGGKSEVRKDKKSKLYYYNENTGLVKPNLPDGQAYMKKHTTFIGENGTPLAPVSAGNNSVNEKDIKNNSVNENSPKKTSWLDNFLSDDE